MARQLDLFAGPLPVVDFSGDSTLAESLPDNVRFGCSSWTFPGWGGVLYRAGTSEAELRRRGLELYVQNPLLRTVGVDRAFYRPLEGATLQRYAEQLPDGFLCVTKVFSEITSACHVRTGEKNESFLNAELCNRVVLEPVRQTFAAKQGPLVFEFSAMRHPFRYDPSEFCERLDRFFGELPNDLPRAVELRNEDLLTPQYVRVLTRHRVSHVFNFWERMPSIRRQLAVPGILVAGDAIVVRLLIPPGRRYAEQKQRFAPFDKIVEPQPEMRADVLDLLLQAEGLGKVAFVIVNNKAEGCSPLTIREIAGQYRSRRETGPSTLAKR